MATTTPESKIREFYAATSESAAAIVSLRFEQEDDPVGGTITASVRLVLGRGSDLSSPTVQVTFVGVREFAYRQPGDSLAHVHIELHRRGSSFLAFDEEGDLRLVCEDVRVEVLGG
ncbi:MAG: hypothetical protein IT379_42320 [Deltaproteobacteria bacterium]|nr:hypothetical protein [Deltaproteobacteria bacterium]